MLVLSRRPDEKIVFPELDITIQVLKISGNVARLGVDAPAKIRILREELKANENCQSHSAVNKRHAINNKLSQISLGLHLFERQRAAGMNTQADATLAKVFAVLDSIESEQSNTSEPLPVANSRQKQILLVEDNQNERELLAGLLGMNGFGCVAVADGVEALEYLSHNQLPDLVLLDMMMPRCDGPTTIRTIRAQPRMANLRVFCVSGSEPKDLGVQTGPEGIDAWFPKPLNPKVLWNALQQNFDSATIKN